MSQALYRKYRPKSWSEIIGQEHVVKTLQNEIKTGRVVHSYLFTGPRGIGKTTIARLLAKALNCVERDESGESCEECGNCRAMGQGNAMNVIEIDAASNTGVDNVRDKIIENTRFLPSGAKYKIFIIDEVHMLSGAAFNALLKTLEEPPAHIIFILATTELHKVPATIISRCQRFDFKKLTAKEIVARLKKIAESEAVKIPETILERVARLAEGGLRDAEGLLGQLFGLGVKDITEEDADLVLPRADLGAALQFLDFLVYKNGREAMLLASEMSECGADIKYFFDNIIELARKLLFLKITGETDAGLPDEIKKRLEKMAQAAALADITKILDILIARRGDVRLLDIPSLPLELTAAEICGDSQQGNIETKKQKNIETEKQEIKYSPSAVEGLHSASSPFEKEGQEGDLKEITSKWPEVLEKIKDFNHSLPFILQMSEPRSFDGKNLSLAIKFKLHKDKLEDPKNYSILTEVLKSVYNKEIFIRPEVDVALSVSVPNEEEVDAESAFGNN